MDRKGLLIIIVTLGLAISYQVFVAAPRQRRDRENYAAQQAKEARTKTEAEEAAAKAAAEAVPVKIDVRFEFPAAPDATAQEALTKAMGEAVANLENFVSTSSALTGSTATVTVAFKGGTDAAKATDLVKARVTEAQPKLPAGAKLLEVAAAKPPPNTAGPAPALENANPATPEPAPEPPSAPPQWVASGPGSVDYEFTEAGGGIAEVRLNEHFLDKAKGTKVVLNEFGSIPIGALTDAPGDEEQTKLHWNMHVDAAAQTVTFDRTDPIKNIKVTKKFYLPKKSDKLREQLRNDYVVRLEISWENVGAIPRTVPYYFLHTGGAAPVTVNDNAQYQGVDWWRDGKSTFQYIRSFAGGGLIFKDAERPEYSQRTDLIRWTGVTSQYFSTIITALGGDDQTEEDQRRLLGTAVWAHTHEIAPAEWDAKGHQQHKGQKLYHLDGALGFPEVILSPKGAPGNAVTRTYQIYAGPREYRRLRLLEHHESDILDYGSFLFISTGPVSRFLLNSMNFLAGFVTHSYPLAIVLLTILVKAALWPLQSKANRSMKKMATLQPKMKELQEKYKGDPSKYQQEIGKLFKQSGVNPVAGCLPMFIQIPIFFGFYNMLGKAVELRNQGFWWVSDLSQPDTVGHLLGLPINILPLLMAATMLLQMKMAPQGGDPGQRKLLMFMPLIFIVMCYNFASALALYWAMQNVISIVQLLINRNREAKEAKPALAR